VFRLENITPLLARGVYYMEQLILQLKVTLKINA